MHLIPHIEARLHVPFPWCRCGVTFDEGVFYHEMFIWKDITIPDFPPEEFK